MKRLVIATLLALSASTLAAEPSAPSKPGNAAVVGTWTLVSYAREDPASRAVTYPWGEKPSGTFVFTADGHVAVVITAQGRQPAVRGEEGFVEKRARLFETTTAYAGTYVVRGDAMSVHVEVASDPDLVGKDLGREIRIDGDALTVRTQPMKSMADGKMYVYALAWKRAR
jgi:hypothetical protein